MTSMQDDYNETAELLRTFTTEGQEMLDEVEPYFVTLQECAELNEDIDPEMLNAIFRLFHTMKGSAGYLELYNMQNVTHEAETLLDLYRKGDRYPTPEEITVLLKSCDFIRHLLDNIAENLNDQGFEAEAEKLVNEIKEMISSTGSVAASVQNAEEESNEISTETSDEIDDSILDFVVTPEMIDQYISESSEELDTLEQDLLELENNPDNQELIDRAFRKLHTFKGNSGLLGFKQLELLSHRLETILDLIRHGKVINIKANIKIVLSVVDVLQEGLDSLVQNGKVKIGRAEIMLELLTDVVKDLDPSIDISVPKEKTEKPKKEKSVKEKQEAKVEQKTASVGKAPVKVEKGKSAATMIKKDIRVDLSKVDKLVDLVGEISLAENMVIKNPDLIGVKLKSFERAAHHLALLVSELQYVSMSLRMIPIAGTFRKMIRLVHDLSYKSGKKVTLQTSGEDTEVDKTVVEQIADPLVHIVRNSIDHGIEPPEERKDLDKEEISVLKLEAKHEGGEVWISIVDDGRGLNRESIIKKAKSVGLIESDADGDSIPDEEVFKYIFEPGFSTAKKITEVSGRGVGMDVVKKNLEKLKGNVDVKSEQGKGTVITLRIPLTLALMDGMLVQVGNSRFIIPLQSIVESIHPKKEKMTMTPDGRETIKVREELISVFRLYRMYNITPKSENIEDSILILLHYHGKRFALMVDQVLGQQQAVIKGLSDYIGDVPGAAGCTILSDGMVSLILDVGNLYSMITN